MCYDKRSSLQAFFFSQVIGWWGFSKGLFWASTFLLVFSTVQLVDAFLWMSQKNKTVNLLISRFVLPILFISEVLVAYYFGSWRNKLWEFSLWIFCILMFFLWIYNCKKPSLPAKDGFLFWCQLESRVWTKLFMYFFLVIPFGIAYPNRVVAFLMVAVATLTFIHSFSKPNWGTHWCYTSNILAFVLLGEILWNEYLS